MEDDSITVYNANDMLLVRSISPPFKINIPPTGIETYYSNMVENPPEVISCGMSYCKINKKRDHINRFSILKTQRLKKIHMDLCVDLICYGNGFSGEVAIHNAPDGAYFEWDVLDNPVVEKLSKGEEAVIEFPTHKVYNMTVRFVPVK